VVASPGDERFGRLAVARGFLSPAQVQSALGWLAARADGRSLARLCRDHGVLTAAQVAELEGELRSAEWERAPGDSDDELTIEPTIPPSYAAGAPGGEATIPPDYGAAAAPSGAADLDIPTPRYDSGKRAARAEESTRRFEESTAPPTRTEPPTGLAGDDGRPTGSLGHRVRLEVRAGPMEGRVFEFPVRDRFLVGRLKSVQVSLSGDGAVSRRHCLVEVCPPRSRVRDLSRNGTRVNGERVRGERDLANGDEIAIGQTALAFALLPPPGRDALAPTPSTARCPVCGGGPDGGCMCQTLAWLPGESAPAGGAPPATPQLDAFPGLTLLEVLGEGPHGLVYRAQRAAGDEVALKTLRPDRPPTPAEADRFLKAAADAARVEHPAAVPLLGSGCHEGVFYFALERVDGPDALAELARRGRPFSLNKGVAIVRRLLGALEAAHAGGRVHGDVKPTNVLLARRGQGFVPRLTDFGLLRVFEAHGLTFTRIGEGRGTPASLPPELLEGAAPGPAADVYGLAATLYYFLCEQPPVDFTRADHPLLAVAEGERIPLRTHVPDVPAAVDAALGRCLAIDPASRPGLAELGQALGAR